MNQERFLPRRLTVVALIFFLTLAIGGAAAVLKDPKTKTAEKQTQPSASATPANDAQLAELLDGMIDNSEFSSARWGVCVVNLADGRTLYTRNADRLFTPASNMKVYTTAVALDVLGTDYRWRTSVYADSTPDNAGTIKGDLVLYGRGAPDLTSRAHKDVPASLTQLVDALYQSGVRHVRGNVIGDDSYFRGESLGDGWLWNDVQWYFGAEPSALSIDDNEVDVEVKPPAKNGDGPIAKLSREQPELEITSDMIVVPSDKRMSVGIHRGLSDNRVHVWGEFPASSKGFGARLSIHHPAEFAATLFLNALKARGIAVDGQATSRDFRTPRTRRFDPTHATELASVSSSTLAEVVRATNKESINLNAELILRTLGRERGASPSNGEQENYERGDDVAGLELIREWLGRNGIQTSQLALHDGCGLSRLDLVKPETTVGLLRAIARTGAASAFHDSLPIAGTDGTLGGRLKDYKDRIVGKTGKLSYDNSLSGYLTTPKGETYVFSIMANDQTGATSSTQLIDKLLGAIADYTAR